MASFDCQRRFVDDDVKTNNIPNYCNILLTGIFADDFGQERDIQCISCYTSIQQNSE